MIENKTMSVFSKIIAGEIPCYKVAENETCFAFLDINPLTVGHVLVVPKKEVDYIFDLNDVSLGELHIFTKRVAKAIQKAYPCKKVASIVLGLDVPHAHIHLIPLENEGVVNFVNPKLKLSSADMCAIAQRIGSFFE